MNKKELVALLKDMASKDLTDDADIYDHPCSVAVRAIEQSFKDINFLRCVAKRRSSQCKRVQELIELDYNPQF